MHKYSGLSKTVTSLRRGDSVDAEEKTEWGFACWHPSFFLRQIRGLTFSLHILSVTWFGYWPFAPNEIKSSFHVYLNKNDFLPDTEYTEQEIPGLPGPRTPPPLSFVEKKQQKNNKNKKKKKEQDNIECHEIKVISKISSTMLISAH